ncbi:hypothetical protein SBOR_0421 [Sclerotinia borealis F-4128]|uniref:Nuclear distribution protein RO10 n=1 Tax=Sclerotinia borealis (strain F-4128) TaxID=1432307 RepID=W9CX38_SCLBF|nr:hypothetical protein SBOR_0421 [Sclerotinia borealis F-4128]
MDNTFDKTASETIDLLEARLRRIEYSVCGHIDTTSITSSDVSISAYERLADLEHILHGLASKSRVIQDLLKLHARYPDLFQSIDPDQLPTTLDTSSILSIVLASASSYPSTASRLTSILDMPIPSAELSAQLINLQPRIAKVEALQVAQNADLSALRQRTAAAIQRWYTVDVLRTGESWAELEERVQQVEQKVRRATLMKRLDDDMAQE